MSVSVWYWYQIMIRSRKTMARYYPIMCSQMKCIIQNTLCFHQSDTLIFCQKYLLQRISFLIRIYSQSTSILFKTDSSNIKLNTDNPSSESMVYLKPSNLKPSPSNIRQPNWSPPGSGFSFDD